MSDSSGDTANDEIVIGGVSVRRAQAARALAATALLAGLTVAGAATAEQSVRAVAPASAATFHLFPGAPKVAISNHGNLVRFEGPVGFDHIGIGEFSEGYVLCYGAVNAYDTGTSESGFGAATANCGATCTITRKTSDNKLQLVQKISRSSATRSATFEMTLKNLTGSAIPNVILRRQADFDVDTGGTKGSGSFVNWFGAGERDSVFAWNPINTSPTVEGHVISLVAVEPTRAFAKVTSSILDSTCNPVNLAANGPVQGDRGVTLQYNIGNLPAGGSVKNTVRYLRN